MLHWLAKTILGAFGWRTEGVLPAASKYVIVGAPHTSNWDFVLMLALALVFRIKVSWMGKHTLFRWPLGALLKRLGGIPIDRTARHNVVEQAVQAFHNSESLILLITPEGTRKKVPYWKTGFYYIAQAANVPIVLAFADYKRKVGGVGPTIVPSGDIEADMRIIRDFYADIVGKYPDQAGDIQVLPRD